jgi:hypothetical protein
MFVANSAQKSHERNVNQQLQYVNAIANGGNQQLVVPVIDRYEEHCDQNSNGSSPRAFAS